MGNVGNLYWSRDTENVSFKKMLLDETKGLDEKGLPS